MLHFNKKYPFRSRQTLFIAIGLVIIGVFLYYVDLFNGELDWLCWFFGGYGIVVIFYYFYRLFTMGKRYFKKLPDFSNSFSFTINEEEIVIKGEKISSVLKWNHFINALITKDLVLLYPNDIRFNIFPAKYFSGNQFDQFVSLVRKKIANCK